MKNSHAINGKFDHSKSRKRRAIRMNGMNGFTMIELLVGIAIVGFLSTLAMPNMRDMVANSRLRSTSNDLLTDLRYARSEAIARNTSVIIEPVTVTVGSNEVVSFSNGWNVKCVSTTACGTLRTHSAPNGSFGFSLTGELSFSSDGRPDSNSAATLLVQPASATGFLRMRCIRVGLNGRPSMTADQDNNMSNGC